MQLLSGLHFISPTLFSSLHFISHIYICGRSPHMKERSDAFAPKGAPTFEGWDR